MQRPVRLMRLVVVGPVGEFMVNVIERKAEWRTHYRWDPDRLSGRCGR